MKGEKIMIEGLKRTKVIIEASIELKKEEGNQDLVIMGMNCILDSINIEINGAVASQEDLLEIEIERLKDLIVNHAGLYEIVKQDKRDLLKDIEENKRTIKSLAKLITT